MRVSCLQENLAKGLAIVGRAVSSRSTMPVLANILLEARDNQLRLAATNLEIGVTCWIGAKVEDEGSITVPARLLTDFVNSLPPDRIDMELTARTQTLNLRCANFDANMKGIDAANFPIIPTIDGVSGDDGGMEGMRIELEASGLRKMVDQVVFAAASDESRPTLTGVEVTFKEGRITLAATDGYRLSVRSAHVDGGMPDVPITVIVPARSLGELARVSADADESRPVQVLVTRERNQILFQVWGKGGESKGGAFHRVELASQLIDANFPDYRAIIPKTHSTRTVVDTASLLKAVRVAFLFARDNANIVRLKIQPANGSGGGHVSLAATSSDMGDSVNDLEAMIEGDDLEISFNAKYLIDVLSQIDEPQVVLETTQPTRPGTIRPLGIGEDVFLHVVMPMHPSR
ncbi:MAG: DNA polymerase III subunit beta [Caldilinea sp.]|nr:DNA polymerase III subunit beta [Caldilineaceae bacterium]MCB9124988.1 DNA polymerase III subunit beta [Caldilineaceae bacterium]MCO5213158.1 DNA polymerase III subunit beta [Caldilinea sp.]MCW5843973.1 DNA polymerase III subunit beta [Caldilinea sp.]